MTEQEWQACRDPDELLDYHTMKRHPRRLRLLAAACARRMWLAVGNRLGDPAFTQLIDVVERYGDGTADRAEFVAARKPFRQAARALAGIRSGAVQVALSVLECLTHDAMEGMTAAVANAREVTRAKAREGAAQCQLIRCIFGTPFRPFAPDPSWLSFNDGAALKLATVICDTRDFHLMPQLADALEEAGCTDLAALAHCRCSGTHALGCHVLDALVGKG